MAFERRAHAVPGAPFLRRLVDKLGDDADRDPRLVVLVDQLRHLHQRAGHALRQHQEGEQRADIDRIVGRQREIDADGIRAADREPLERPHAPLE